MNPRPTAYEAGALTPELLRRVNADVERSALGLVVLATFLFALFEFALAPVFDAAATLGVFAFNGVHDLLVNLHERRGIVGLQTH